MRSSGALGSAHGDCSSGQLRWQRRCRSPRTKAIVDERGYVYAVGTDATGGIAMQMVAAPALPLGTAAAAAHATAPQPAGVVSPLPTSNTAFRGSSPALLPCAATFLLCRPAQQTGGSILALATSAAAQDSALTAQLPCAASAVALRCSPQALLPRAAVAMSTAQRATASHTSSKKGASD